MESLLVGTLAYQKVTVRDGEEELDEGLQGIIKGIISIEAENAKVDVAAAQGGLEHGEADGDPFELQGVHLVLRNLPQGQDAVPCKGTAKALMSQHGPGHGPFALGLKGYCPEATPRGGRVPCGSSFFLLTKECIVFSRCLFCVCFLFKVDKTAQFATWVLSRGVQSTLTCEPKGRSHGAT